MFFLIKQMVKPIFTQTFYFYIYICLMYLLDTTVKRSTLTMCRYFDLFESLEELNDLEPRDAITLLLRLE